MIRAGDRAAAGSIELIGKHLGIFIDPEQTEIAYLDEYLAKIMKLVNAKVIDHEPAVPQWRKMGTSNPTCWLRPGCIGL